MNLLSIFSKKWQYISICCLFVFLLVCRIYAIYDKSIFFYDENFTFVCSTPNNKTEDNKILKENFADFTFETNKDYKVLSIKKSLFESKSDIKSIADDLVFLHNNTIDRQHPNLYLSIFRIWTSGMDYSNSDIMKWRGCSLNLIFFLLSFFFMFKLLNLINKDKTFVMLGLLFAFISGGSISNTILIRGYQLMEAFFILAIYIFIILFNNIDKKVPLTVGKIFLYGFCLGLFFLTEYYSLLLGAFIFIAIAYKSFAKKSIESFKQLIILFFIAFTTVLLVCPLYFINFKSICHMSETIEASNIWNFVFFHWHGIYLLKFLSKFIFNNIVFFLILLGLYIIGVPVLGEKRFNKYEYNNFILAIVPTFCWSYLICSISPFHQPECMRYIIAGFPILGLINAFIIYHLRNSIKFILIIIYIITTIFTVFYGLNWYNSKYKCLGEIAYSHNYYGFKDPRLYIYNEKTKKARPIVIVKNWFMSHYILFLEDNNNILRIVDKAPSQDGKYIFDEYLLINTFDMNIISKEP